MTTTKQEPQTRPSREAVILEMDRQLSHVKELKRGSRGEERKKLQEWNEILAEAKRSLMDNTLSDEQIRHLVRKGCRLCGAIPANQVGPFGEAMAWVTSSEEMSRNVRATHNLGDLLRTQLQSVETEAQQ